MSLPTATCSWSGNVGVRLFSADNTLEEVMLFVMGIAGKWFNFAGFWSTKCHITLSNSKQLLSERLGS